MRLSWQAPEQFSVVKGRDDFNVLRYPGKSAVVATTAPSQPDPSKIHGNRWNDHQSRFRDRLGTQRRSCGLSNPQLSGTETFRSGVLRPVEIQIWSDYGQQQPTPGKSLSQGRGQPRPARLPGNRSVGGDHRRRPRRENPGRQRAKYRRDDIAQGFAQCGVSRRAYLWKGFTAGLKHLRSDFRLSGLAQQVRNREIRHATPHSMDDWIFLVVTTSHQATDSFRNTMGRTEGEDE